MGTALPVLIGLPLMGGPGGERERPVDGGAIDIDLPGGLRGAVLGAGALVRGPVLGGAGALRGPVLGALGGSLDEPPPGVGGGERDLGALGGGCDFVALALAFGGAGGAPGPLGGGPLGGGALGGPFGGGAPGPGPGPAMSAATLAVSGVSARMLAVRSLSMRSVRAMP
jgi:hypothetical protein